ncbi:hypothetical protein ACEWY4_013144 [Coilia grayii]|uniref:Protein phosphatase 1 regulatory subunit 15A/B C-terminal domain-containing protein n=1 Tax=Coilia grayii TaxID=363190 RepID=A0ABD1JVG1_9TELE
MFNMDSEHYSRGKTISLPAGVVTSLRHEGTERSWMDMLSFVSRPAWSLLQRYLPGNSLSAPQSHSQLWDTESLEQQLGFGHKVTRLEDALSNRQPQVLDCNAVDNNSLHSSVQVGGMAWLKTDSLSEIGIQNMVDRGTPQVTSGYLSSARNFLSQFFMLNLVSTQEVKHAPSSLLGRGAAAEGAHRCVSVLSWSRETSVVAGTSDATLDSGSLCHVAERTTIASVAKPTGLFVHCDDGSSKHSESAGHCCHKAESENHGLHILRPASLSSEHQLSDQANTISLLGDISVAACASSEVILLTPEQDNGYSSLEEELSFSRLPTMRRAGEEQSVTESESVDKAQHSSAEQQGKPRQPDHQEESGTQVPEPEEEAACDKNEQQEHDHTDLEQAEVSAGQEEKEGEVPGLSEGTVCRNKAIAYIMGSPCSDDSSSGEDSDEDSADGDEEGEEEEDDDDGFNSEGSAYLSDCDSSEEEDIDDDDEDYDEQSGAEEFDAETERLWNSLCQNRDPYNPRNFTASICTASASASSSFQPLPPSDSPPASLIATSPLSASPPLSSSPPLSASPLSSSPGSSSWSGDDGDDAESLKLWDSFSCSSDPYNPFNFQATLRTRSPPAVITSKACAVPRYQSEQAEERQDSGFGDEMPAPSTSALPCRKLRKVRFCEEVEEFYTSGDEDRRGPWEEYARDRCRFQRRVLEVEESIAFCLAPDFRLQVLRRLQLS